MLASIAFTISLVSATIVISLVIAATFAPLVLALRARGWPNALAAALVTGSAVLILGAIFFLVALAFAPYVSEVIQGISNGIAEAKSAVAAAGLSTESVDAVDQAVTQVEGWVKSNIDQIAGAVASVVTIAILSIFLVFFLLSDGNKAWVWMLGSTSDRDRGEIESSGHRALERVGGYLRGMAVLASVMAAVEFLFLVVLGVPLAAPLAVLVFLGGFIPYVGGLITTVVLVVVTAGTNGAQAATILLILIGILTFDPRQGPPADHLRPLGRPPSGGRAARAAGRSGGGGDRRPLCGHPGRRVRDGGHRLARRGHRAVRAGNGPRAARAAVARPAGPVELADPGRLGAAIRRRPARDAGADRGPSR